MKASPVSAPSVVIDASIGPDDAERIQTALAAMAPIELDAKAMTVLPLSGGGSNENYLVFDGDVPRYVLRIAASLANSTRFGIDRWAGVLIHREAAHWGLAPALRGVVFPIGDSMTDFLSGGLVTPTAIREGGGIEECVTLIRTAHARLRGTDHRFGAVADITSYLALARDEGLRVPEDIDALVADVARVEEAFAGLPIPHVVCHNDPTTTNFFRADGRLWLLDWEYAGLGNPYFDLAAFVSEAALDDGEIDRVLRAYFGGVRACDRARILAQRFLADMREATWAVAARPVLAATGYDHAARAHEFFARARVSAHQLTPAVMVDIRAGADSDELLFNEAFSHA
ncbi:phosphotransferase [Microbacterium sp. NPDC055357]